MGVGKKVFGKFRSGEEVPLYELRGKGGLTACVTPYGAIVHALVFNGVDVLLGYDSFEDYVYADKSHQGATIGRYANRIGRGKFTLNGKEYTLACNASPVVHLHGGVSGFGKKLWNVDRVADGDEPSVTFSYLSPDGDENYPGELLVAVTQTVTGDNAFRLAYRAEARGDTVLNLTNHAYFNLDGADGGDILGTVLTIPSGHFTVLDADHIPTGEIRSVENTVFDFRKPKAIGRDIGVDDEQLRLAGGYDLNYVLPPEGFQFAASAYSGKSRIKMDCFTDQPAIQLYTGNMLTADRGKKGIPLYYRQGFCLETQHYPDSPNHSEFPSTVLRAGETFETVTEYRFGTV
ncbi:MAG: galactose mutarotase [Firmicutes bacterium]|nr:galactose mutarotase [Bacillota bacterium]